MIRNSHFFNFINKFALTFFRLVVPLILVPFLYRAISPNEMGIVDFSISFVTYFYIIGDFGLSMYGIREIAKIRDKDPTLLINKLYSIRNTLNFFVLAVYVFIVLFFFKEDQSYTFLLICITNIIANFFNVEWVNEGQEKFRFITLKTIIVRIVYVLCVFLLVRGENASVFYLLLTGCSLVINNIVSFIYVKKNINFKYSFKLFEFRYLKDLFLVFFTINSGVLFFQIDKFILGLHGRFVDVSYYALGERIVLILVTLMTAAITFLTPKLSSIASNQVELNRLISKNFSLINLILIPICFGLYTTGDQLLILLASKNYSDATKIIPYSAGVLFFYSILEFFKTNVFIVNKKEYIYVVLFIIIVLLNIFIKIIFADLSLLNFELILLVSLSIFCLIVVVYLFKQNIKIPIKDIAKYFIFSLPILAFKEVEMGGLIGTIFIKVILSSCIYLILLYLAKDEFVTRILKFK